MNLRNTVRATAIFAACALALTACGGDDNGGSGGGGGPLGAITVVGAIGSEPELEFDTPFEVTEIEVQTIDVGTGAPIEEGQSVFMHYLLMLGDGTRLGSTWTDFGGQTDQFTAGAGELETPPIVQAAIEGQRVGARVLVAEPTFAADGSLEVVMIMIAELVDARTVPARAEGETVTPPAGLPVVTVNDATGEPSLGEVPAAYQDVTELVVQTLIRGDGPVVEPGASVTIHYTGWTPDGEVFDSSWERGTITFPLNNLIAGWQQGIPGQTVGSQVLLIIPAALAYGEDPAAHHLGGQTLIFVIDILDAN
ncbi:MAG: FKBP-type peptidyl-prolyl cis-trans isomerase [Promicromonosporaceae bacterium]|nr:FKBP-type peptidyl-prolyl cis-trans isomerase [Promicromonosporaceae bacterium]